MTGITISVSIYSINGYNTAIVMGSLVDY